MFFFLQYTIKKSALGISEKSSVSFNQPKKRVKQINLFSQEGLAKDVVMLKGKPYYLCLFYCTVYRGVGYVMSLRNALYACCFSIFA